MNNFSKKVCRANFPGTTSEFTLSWHLMNCQLDDLGIRTQADADRWLASIRLEILDAAKLPFEQGVLLM
jgi:hypothetical protein